MPIKKDECEAGTVKASRSKERNNNVTGLNKTETKDRVGCSDFSVASRRQNIICRGR